VVGEGNVEDAIKKAVTRAGKQTAQETRRTSTALCRKPSRTCNLAAFSLPRCFLRRMLRTYGRTFDPPLLTHGPGLLSADRRLTPE